MSDLKMDSLMIKDSVDLMVEGIVKAEEMGSQK